MKSSVMICTVTKYVSVDKVDKNEISRTCSTYGGRWVAYTSSVVVGNPEGKRQLESTQA